MNELLAQHTEWLSTHLALVYCAVGGAVVRLLLIRQEPLVTRMQNCIAGVILALVLAPPTAGYFNGGDYSEGYALFYGVVARELVVSFVDTFNEKALPLLHKLLDSLPFMKHDHISHDSDYDANHADESGDLLPYNHEESHDEFNRFD